MDGCPVAKRSNTTGSDASLHPYRGQRLGWSAAASGALPRSLGLLLLLLLLLQALHKLSHARLGSRQLLVEHPAGAERAQRGPEMQLCSWLRHCAQATPLRA